MYLIYRPDGQEEQRWQFDPGKLGDAEAEGIERRTNMAYGSEFKEALLKGNIRARKALLWTLLRREHHILRYEDVHFLDDELVLEMDRDEWIRTREVVAADQTLDDDDRACRLALIDAAMVDAPEAPGKALANTGDAATP